jgi:hypothetical protein
LLTSSAATVVHAFGMASSYELATSRKVFDMALQLLVLSMRVSSLRQVRNYLLRKVSLSNNTVKPLPL